MATQLQELQAKRKELQATNPNASMLDARNALTPAIANSPVAGQPPATTPPNTPSNKEVLAQNQAKVQAEIQAGTRPEAGFVGNAVQELGGDVANRQNTRNVMTGQGGTRTPNGAILNADGTVTQTPESLAANAGSTIVGNQYDQRTPEQKAVGATATPEQAAKSTGGVIGGTPTIPTPTTPTATNPETPKTPTQTTPPVPTDKNGIFNALATGQAVTPTNTPEYRKAKASYDTFQKFNGMSKQQFIDNIKQGQITTELNSQLASNPVFQEAKAEIDKINRANGINTMITNISQGLSGNAIATPDYFETISANLIKKYGLTTNESQNAFKQIVSEDEDVVKATKELSEINRQVAETTQLINDGYKEIRQKYQGKLSATQLISYMDNRFRSATDTLNALNTQRQYVEADLKTATDMAINEYNAFQKDLADRNALRNTLIQSELGLASRQAELALQEQYAKPQFQQYGDKVYQLVDGQLVDTGISTTSNQWQSANITRYNPSTGANESTPIFYRKKDTGAGFEAVDLAGNPIDANLLGGGAIGTGTTGTTGGYATSSNEMRTDRNNNPTAFTVDIAKQAGLVEGVDYVVGDKFPGSSNLYTAKLIGDPIETSIRVIDKIGFKTKSGQNRWTYTDKLGLTNETWANMSPTEKAIAIKKMYQQEGGNGKAIGEVTQTSFQFTPSQVLDFQNYKSTGKVPDTYKTPADQARFRQNYDSWSSSQEQLQVSQYTDQNIADLAYLVELQEKNPTQASKEMKELGYTSRDLANYKGGNVPLTDRQKQSSINLANSIKDLLTNYDYTDATGFHYFDEAPRGSDWASAEEKIKTIVANMTLPNLGMLKGPMSDKDLAFIQAASSNLATSQSDATFGKQLLDAYNIAARRAGLPEAKTLDDIKKEATTTTNSGAGQTVSGNKGTYTW